MLIFRAAWSLSNTQSRYIICSEDTYIGRACTLLDHSSTKFAALPPHFDSGYLSEELLLQILNDPAAYLRKSNEFKRVYPFLIATIIYHQSYLRKSLPSHHPLFKTKIFEGFPIPGAAGFFFPLTLQVHAGYFKNEITQMSATGLPNTV
jgi:hypothetical protein